MNTRIVTEADRKVADCLKAHRSFALVAGAGSGKTSSLVDALGHIRSTEGALLRKNGQRVACITYTRRAVAVIQERLGADDLFCVSTLHSFIWGEIGRFKEDIRDALKNSIIPSLIDKQKEIYGKGSSRASMRAREREISLNEDLGSINTISNFIYDDSVFSRYSEGVLSHDDIIGIIRYFFEERPKFGKLLGQRYPFIFIDEAQDTFPSIIEGLNRICEGDGLPLVGYFGDPWQQIYEGRAGDFAPPYGGEHITKTENFRSSPEVIRFLNKFRSDVKQIPAGKNKNLVGSVSLCLIKRDAPKGARNRYTEDQLKHSLSQMDRAIDFWGWKDKTDVVRLFLVRQMIARRLRFESLNLLFTGPFASQNAKNLYEDGDHFLLKPFIQFFYPLRSEFERGNQRRIIDILRDNSPAFDPKGRNASRSLQEMIDFSNEIMNDLSALWLTGTVKDILCYAQNKELLQLPQILRNHLARAPRTDQFDEDVHSEEKGDWLADKFFAMGATEIQNYCNFISQNTPYSTQHGVKGEEFPDVLVVYDDVEAAWNHYSFTRLLTPQTAGQPTDGQKERGKKLAYVSFSRARENLRILLFTEDPKSSRDELIRQNLLTNDQIFILQDD